MKKTIITIAALAAAGAAAFAQGTVAFADSLTGAKMHIFAPQSNPYIEVQGNCSIDSPSGTTAYIAGTLVGGSAVNIGPLGVLGNGDNITVQLYASPGSTATSFSQLSPV